MERIAFAQIADLSEYMINRVEDKEYIVAALFFDDAVELMKNLLLYEEVQVGSIDIADFEYDGYTGEYYVSLLGDYTLCVERALSSEKYLKTDAALILLDGDVKQAIVEANDESECIEISIGEDEYIECNCNNCYAQEMTSDNIEITLELSFEDVIDTLLDYWF